MCLYHLINKTYKEVKILNLKLGNFYVKDINFGEKTEFKDSVLTINKAEAIQFIMEDTRITECDLVIAKPGDEKRLVPVKAAVEARCKVEGGTLYPGIVNDIVPAGEGVTYCLKGMSILSIGKHYGGFQDGLIDMSGEGAKYSYFSTLINLCIVADTNEEHERYEQQKRNLALRWAGIRLSEYLGEAVRDLSPEDEEIYSLNPVTERSAEESLPKVVYITQLDSQMKILGYNTLVYGWDANRMLPSFIHPNEILDGAITGGSFTPSSSVFSTYDMTNNPTIKRLYKEHGKTINFLGVIIDNNSAEYEEKKRTTMMSVNLAKNLGAKAAIVNEHAYGNPDADFVATLAALKDAGITAVGITAECTGRDGASQPLVTLDEKADAIVSTGNVSELIELPPMKEIVGELKSLNRDGFAGAWGSDELLGPSVREDGSIIMENNSIYIGDMTTGFSVKTVKEF